jgi:hypothetical protein
MMKLWKTYGNIRKKRKKKLIITGSAEPKLIIGPPPPGLPLDWWVLKKLGCCYTFWFSWLTIWHHVNWNHSPSHTVQVSNRAWNFGNLNPNVDWIVRQALHSTTHVVAPRLIIRTSNEGERKGIVGRYLRLYICEETGQPFF